MTREGSVVRDVLLEAEEDAGDDPDDCHEADDDEGGGHDEDHEPGVVNPESKLCHKEKF